MVTLWSFNSSLLNMAIEIVDLPMNSMVIFHSFLYVYQRVVNYDLLYLYNYAISILGWTWLVNSDNLAAKLGE